MIPLFELSVSSHRIELIATATKLARPANKRALSVSSHRIELIATPPTFWPLRYSTTSFSILSSDRIDCNATKPSPTIPSATAFSILSSDRIDCNTGFINAVDPELHLSVSSHRIELIATNKNLTRHPLHLSSLSVSSHRIELIATQTQSLSAFNVRDFQYPLIGSN